MFVSWINCSSPVKEKNPSLLSSALVVLLGFSTSIYICPFPKRQILDSSKLKEFADDNCKFDEDGRKFAKWVENTVGKGDIALYDQFLLFPQCFLKTCIGDT